MEVTEIMSMVRDAESSKGKSQYKWRASCHIDDDVLVFAAL
jgi:hypothetical protein